MKLFYTAFFKTAFVIFCFFAESAIGQTPTYFKGTGTGTNTIPMNTAGSHCQQIYLPTDFNAVPISGNITKIYFRNSVAGGSGVYTNFEVNFLQNNLSAFPNSTFLTGFTTALSMPSITISGNAVAGGWYEIPLATPFLYDNSKTLICEIKYTAKTGGMSGYTTTAVGNKRLSIITAPGAATGNLSTLWGDFGIDVAPASPGIDMSALNLINPPTQTCNSNTENATVKIRNNSSNAINFATNPVTVTLNVSGAATATLTQVVNSGSLASNTTMDVNFTGTINMSTAGTYTFNASTGVVGDINPANDAMPAVTRTVAPTVAGTVSAAPGSYCITGGIPTLSLSGNSGGTIQWQESTASATGPWTNVGTNSTTYVPASAITTTTYYRAILTCFTNSSTSSVATVAVNNPQVLTTVPGSSCGPGTVVLGATGSAGSTLNWYQNSTGGSVLGTGTSFTTPSISSNTTFYVNASAGSATQSYHVGLVNTAGYSFLTQTAGWGAIFTANTNCTLDSVYVYPTGTGTITIKILDLTNNLLFTGPTVNITGTGTQKIPVYIGATLVPGSYKMGMSSTGVTNLGSQTTGSSMGYPFVSVPLTITSGSQGSGAVAAVYYWFYDWVVSTGSTCQSARTAVLATVTTPPSAAISYTGTTFCSGGGIIPVVMSGTTGGTYSSSPAGLSINTGTGAINLAASSAGNYTVTYSIAASGGCALYTTTTPVSVNAAPSATILYSGSPYCNSGTASVTRTGSGGGTYSSTPGISINTSTGDINLNASTAGTYVVTYNIAATGGCPSFSTSATIVINPNPAAPLTATSSMPSFCSSGSINLSVTGTLTPGASWVWYRGNCGGTSIGTGAILNNVPVTATTTFYVRAESACNNSSCVSVTVTALSNPVVVLTPTPFTSINPSMRTYLAATVSPYGNYTYSWYKNGVLIPFTGDILTIDADGFGSYYVVAKDVNGCSAQSGNVSVSELISSALFIYPNPNKGQFQVRYYSQNASSAGQRTLSIFDGKGSLVFSKIYTPTAPYSGMYIDMSNRRKGVYFAFLTDASGNKIASGKVIVN